MYYHGARYYAAWLGRWISCDPSGIGDGVNVYNFVHDAPINEVDSTGADGEPWWRFTEAGGQYQTGKNDIFQTNSGYDTGFAPANLVVNLFVTASNLCTIPFNAVTELAAIPEDIARAAGASEQDIEAMNFALMMTGVGEVAVLPRITRAATAATEAKNAATVFIEAKDAAIAAVEAKKVATAAAEAKKVATAAAEAKKVATAAAEAKKVATAGVEAKKVVTAAAEVKNVTAAEAALGRTAILSKADEALAPLAKQFPDAKVGIRGSLARGTKGPHKGGALFDPTNFDVDAFIVSDKLAGMVPPNAQGFRNLARKPEFGGLVRSIGEQLKKIPGIRPDTFKVRVFSAKEFEATVKANERYFLK